MKAASPKPTGFLPLQWWRLKRSAGRRWREWRLPKGFERLGTRYGGWWIYGPALSRNPLLIDCGLGRDISFPAAFLARFGGEVIGVDPNPDALEYARAHCPPGMTIRAEAFWTRAGERLEFHMPRPASDLPKGADGVSGSLLSSHTYAGGSRLAVRSTSLPEILAQANRPACDVLKLDIEGAEFDVLRALRESGELRRVGQLLVEFHHGITARTLQDTRAEIAALQASGFTLCHTEDRNAHFLRHDLANAG